MASITTTNKPNTTITVYINPDCGPCNKLKDWLKEKDITHTQKDVINDAEAFAEFKRIGGTNTPTTLITIGLEQFEIIGFYPKEIEAVLALSKKIIFQRSNLMV